MDMHMMHTQTTGKRSNNWQRTLVMLSIRSMGMRFVFTTELRDTGRYGFVLPKDQIIPSGEEMWAGFETVVAKVLEVSN